MLPKRENRSYLLLLLIIIIKTLITPWIIKKNRYTYWTPKVNEQ